MQYKLDNNKYLLYYYLFSKLSLNNSFNDLKNKYIFI